MTDTCPSCENHYKALGQHWRYNPTHKPNFTEYQKELITGVLMGDGTINTNTNANPRMRVTSITKDYLEYLDEMFGVHSLGVNLKTTAEEAVDRNIKTEFSPNAKVENYSDLYELRTRNNPELSEFADWYSSGKKKWPDIKLTPIVLKNLYVCDGSFNHRKSQVHISCSNEIDNKQKVENMFSRAGLSIDNWNDKTRNVNGYEGSTSTSIVINKSNHKKFFDYIGQPLPGFKYKWPETYK